MNDQEVFITRLEKVECVMEEKGVKCLLLNRSRSIKYLTGADNTCSWVFLARGKKRLALVLESDFKEYRSQSILEDIRIFTAHDPLGLFRQLVDELKLGEGDLALEKDHLKLSQFEMVERYMENSISHELNADAIVEEARMIKTSDEINWIRKASVLACVGARFASEAAEKGMTEYELSRRVYEFMVGQGADRGTTMYLGTDDRSGLAHNPPSDTLLDKGPVVIDIHASYRGFHADMARTILLDDTDGEVKRLYESFRDMTLRTIQSFEPGMKITDAKKLYYAGIKEYSDLVILTGPFLHGVGWANYELPKMDHPFEARGYPEFIQPGMILACTNIGLYSRDGWGVRYEDTFLVDEEGVLILTQY